MNSNSAIQNVVIVGGGTAGWIAAASIARLLGNLTSIKLVESDDIGTVGVGEATIPQILRLNAILGLDENDFMRHTQATFKLGIEFNNWSKPGTSYLHTFGEPGLNLAGLHFHQYWLRYHQQGGKEDFWEFSLHNTAAYQNRFARLDRVADTAMAGLAYAFHFDAGLYARYLRNYAEKLGVVRTEGIVDDVQLRSADGFIESIKLKSGEVINGDLFIDCTGFRGLLIGQALEVGYQDWSHWLPCNRALAVPTESVEPPVPYTRATAREAGWQWRIPLQHRVGNGHVYCSEFISDERAAELLTQNLDAPLLADPRPLRFTTGRRDKFWHKNCVAIGLSSGFMEPLESTSIHLIQANVGKLIELFPQRHFADADIAEYNRQVAHEFDLIRDFLILHYKLTEREDSGFWNYCRTMSIPDTLASKIELFADSGRIFREPNDLFRDASWVQVMLGQGIKPKYHHRLADRISDAQLAEFMVNVKTVINKAVAPLPTHDQFIAQQCKAKS